jgi:hypothetical protein
MSNQIKKELTQSEKRMMMDAFKVLADILITRLHWGMEEPSLSGILSVDDQDIQLDFELTARRKEGGDA